MRFFDFDDIRSQFVGPVCAALLLIKHRALLHVSFDTRFPGLFATNDATTQQMLDILFAADKADLRADLAAVIAVADPEAGKIMEDALLATANLSPNNKMRALDFINAAFKYDRAWVNRTKAATVDLTGPGIVSPYKSAIIAWYLDDDVAFALNAIRPIRRPDLETAKNKYGIYGSYAEYEAYANQYYGYATYYEYYNYNDTHGFGGHEAEEIRMELREYLNSRLCTDGIRSPSGLWTYKSLDQQFPAVVLDSIMAVAYEELPTIRNIRFAQTTWAEFGHCAETAAHASRTHTLDQLLFGAMSEATKGPHKSTIRSLLKKG